MLLAVGLALVTPRGVPGQQPSDTVLDPAARAGDSLSIAEAEALEARLRAAIQVTPEVASFHASLGEVLHAQGRSAEARIAYAEAVRLDPDNPAYRAGLGSTALAQREWLEAETQFAWGAQLAPDDPAMHLGLGEAILAQDRPELAASHFRRAIELSDTMPAIRARAEDLLPRTAGGAGVLAGAELALAIALRFLTYLSMIVLVSAGIALVLPVAAAVSLLLVIAPLGLLRRKQM